MSEVVVLGGAGLQGAAAARALGRLDGIERVVVVDRDVHAAEQVAASIGGQAQHDQVDARDSEDVKRVLQKWQPRVVLNCVGPFRRFGPSTLTAAIASGVDYVDLLDDAEVVGSYLALDDAARAAGVTAAFGVGFTPGLTNIIGRHLATGLDSVEEIHYAYIVNATLSVPTHLMTHRVQMFARDAMIVRDGELLSVPGGSDPVELDWPGVGSFPASVCTHPEPICAHQHYPGVRHSTIRGCYTCPEFLGLLVALGTSGWGESTAFRSNGAELGPDVVIGDFLTSDVFEASATWSRMVEAEERYGAVDGVRVAVSGWQDGKLVRRAAHQICHDRWFTTHTTAAVGAALMATGVLHAPGVHSAEVFEPAPTLAALAAVGIEITEVDAEHAPEFARSGALREAVEH
jgi:saccharopine dehydrogenase (NAD+, L-lysine-forming)